MKTIQTTETEFEIKINGETLSVNFEDMHPTWVAAHLRKAAQRFLNDRFSGEKGDDKLRLVREALQEIHSGEEMPETVRRSSVVADPVTALAVKNAKATLVAVFKQRDFGAKIADWVDHPKAGKYFQEIGGTVAWNDEEVIAWMDTKPGGVDYRADAENALAVEI